MNQSPLARAAAAQPVRVAASVSALTTSAAAPRSALPVGMQPDRSARAPRPTSAGGQLARLPARRRVKEVAWPCWLAPGRRGLCPSHPLPFAPSAPEGRGTPSGLALCAPASTDIPWHGALVARVALRARTPGSDLRRAPQLAGAAFGSGGGLLAECAEALDKLKLSKRPAQQAALESIAYGADLLYVDRTGGGKSLTFQLPAALAWRTAVLAGETLPPILLCVVPYISLGEHQRAAFEALLARMYAAGLLPRLGHVCFVRRAAKGADAPTTAAVAVSPLPGLASATAADTAKSAGGLPAGSRPASLPCGACVGCRGELASNQLGRLPKVKGQPCCWSCRVATTDRDAWCEWCRSSHATGNKVQQQGRGGCAERLRLLGLASSAPATQSDRVLAARTAACASGHGQAHRVSCQGAVSRHGGRSSARGRRAGPAARGSAPAAGWSAGQA